VTRKRLTAKFLTDLGDRINANKQIAKTPEPMSQTTLGTTLTGSEGDPGFWAMMGTETSAGIYDFTLATWNDGIESWDLGTLTGSAPEANGVTGLSGKIGWIPNIQGDYAWVWHWKKPCVFTLCIAVWSTAAYCAIINADEGPSWDCTTVPGGITGASVTVTHLKHDGVTEVAFASGSTDDNGFYCPEMGPILPEPVDDPTLDPIGAGTSGGDLPVGTYVAAYASMNDWGITKISNRTAEFQVGIPNHDKYPLLAPPSSPTHTASSGGLLVPGTYTVKAVFVDGSGNHNLPTVSSSPFTLVTLGDIWTVTLPVLASRDFATAIDVYVSNGGSWYLYKSGVTTSTVDLDTAFLTATLAPTTNTSLLNIPRMGFTPAGDTTKLFAIEQTGLGLDGFVLSELQPASTAPLMGMNPDSLPPRNSTGDGIYRVRASEGDCAGGPCDIDIEGDCGANFVGIGLCCYEMIISTMDADTLGATGIDPPCGSGIVVNQGTCGMPPCPGPPAPDTPLNCDLSWGTTHECDISHEGYLTRCIDVATMCGVPTDTITYTVLMYPTSGWVNQPGCPCAIVDPSTRPPGILPKTLFLSILGPEALTGSSGAVLITVTYDPTASSSTVASYTSGCLGAQGGYGWCQPSPTGSEHCYYKFNSDPCFDAYGNPNFINLGNPFIPTKVFYQSTKVTVDFLAAADECKGSPYGSGEVVVTWKNYWNPDCPAVGLDPAPLCGWSSGGIPVHAFPQWPCSYFNCDCGINPADSPGYIHGYCGSYVAEAKKCTNCVNQVNITGSGMIDGLFPGDCPPCIMEFTLTE